MKGFYLHTVGLSIVASYSTGNVVYFFPTPVRHDCKLHLDLRGGTVSSYAHLCLSVHIEIQDTVVHAVWMM